MNTDITFLQKLHGIAKQQYCRFGIVASGSTQWETYFCQDSIDYWPTYQRIFCFGFDGGERCHNLMTHQGQQVLGQECHLLIWNLSEPWDANSFSAAIGTLSGGGVLIFVGQLQESHAANQWLNDKLSQLLIVTPDNHSPLPVVPFSDSDESSFTEQLMAIDAIKHVVTGHRKRPLILTAERGRGKTSALGIASADLMYANNKNNIAVTAPSKRALQPLYSHLLRCLPQASQEKDTVYFGNATLRFVALDCLLRTDEKWDLVLVDEAAAFPVPMLQSLVERCHRTIFSTTINGYEGCGRGFTLTFQNWLMAQRPGTRHMHMSLPIRWQKNDPLEKWYREALLLNHRLPNLMSHSYDKIRLLTPKQLVAEPNLLQQLFTLLVSAHYQTSPNDVFQILNDSAIQIVATFRGDDIVGCALLVTEGELSNELIQDICLGKRRPKGQLGAITLANQLGIPCAARQRSLRIMRIAVHSDVQGLGIGSEMIKFVNEHLVFDFLSTSFGCTPSLLAFWKKSGFVAIKLGSKRDQSSGCHSAFMVHAQSCSWLEDALEQFRTQLLFELNDAFCNTDVDTLKLLVAESLLTTEITVSARTVSLVEYYALGGSNYESVAANLYQVVLRRLVCCQSVSGLLFSKVVQKLSWSECAVRYKCSGKKQVEKALREEVLSWLRDLQCK